MKRATLLLLASSVAVSAVWLFHDQRALGRSPAASARVEASESDRAALRIPAADSSPAGWNAVAPSTRRADVEPKQAVARTFATVEGIVRTWRGATVPGARVTATSGDHPVLERVADADGRFTFEELVPAEYTLSIVAESLPTGVVPPVMQGRCRHELNPSHVNSTCVSASPNGVGSVELVVFEGATVVGRVLDVGGEPVADMHVRLTCVGSYLVPSMDTKTDGTGEFTFSGVVPDEYELRVSPGPRSELSGVCRPKCSRFVVPEGDWIVLPDARFRTGIYGIRGRVVDQYGAAVSGIAVLCHEDPGNWGNERVTVGTDDAGDFEFTGLPAGKVGLFAGLRGRVGYRDVDIVPRTWPYLRVALGTGDAMHDFGVIVLQLEDEEPTE